MLIAKNKYRKHLNIQRKIKKEKDIRKLKGLEKSDPKQFWGVLTWSILPRMPVFVSTIRVLGNWRTWESALKGEGFTWIKELPAGVIKNIEKPRNPKLPAITTARNNHGCWIFESFLGDGFRVANAAGIRGIRAEMIISFPSPSRGSNGTGATAPRAEPAMDAK